VVGYRHYLGAGRAGLDHAAFVLVVVRAFGAEVDLDAGEPAVEAGEAGLQLAGHVGGQLLAAVDLVVGVDLDLHADPPDDGTP
jgi:hypothetical protein